MVILTDLVFDNFSQNIDGSFVFWFTYRDKNVKILIYNNRGGGGGFNFLTINIFHVLQSRLEDVHGH